MIGYIAYLEAQRQMREQFDLPVHPESVQPLRESRARQFVAAALVLLARGAVTAANSLAPQQMRRMMTRQETVLILAHTSPPLAGDEATC